jgi:hypothetical protein
MPTLYFDIETAPLPESELSAMCPAFDASEVAIGNTKDPQKIAEKIAEARRDHFPKFVSRAALSAITGRVCAIGFMYGRECSESFPVILDDDDEKHLLSKFFREISSHDGSIVGFNIQFFDIPFLTHRAWALGIPVPYQFQLRNDRFFGDWIVDLRNRWQMGDKQRRGKLDEIARHLGIDGKTGDHGRDFHKLLHGTPEQRETALAYLRQDVELCRQVERRMRFGAF